MKMYTELKEAKQKYKDLYHERKMAASEYDFVKKLADSTRFKLITKFEEWYHNTFEKDPNEEKENEEEEVIHLYRVIDICRWIN